MLRRCAMTMKLTRTDEQAVRQTDRWTDGQDHVLSQADALTKNEWGKMNLYLDHEVVQNLS